MRSNWYYKKEEGVWRVYGICVECGAEYTFSDTRLQIFTSCRCEACQIQRRKDQTRRNSLAYYYRQKAKRRELSKNKNSTEEA